MSDRYGGARPSPRPAIGAAAGSGGAAFLLTQFLAGAGNFGFHLVATRLLGPAGYGLLGSLVVAFAALAVPVEACGTMLAATVVRCRERGEPVDPSAATRRALAVGAVACAALMATAPFAVGYLRMPSIWSLAWAGLYAIVLAAGTVPWAMLCGHGRFAVVGVAAVGGITLRFGLLIVLAHLGWGVTGALAAIAVAEAARVVVVSGAALRLAAPRGVPAHKLRLSARRAVGGTTAITGLWLLVGIDTMLARHLFEPVIAGGYAAAATLSRSVFFVIQTGCVLALPRFCGGRAHGALRAALAIALAAGLVSTAGLLTIRPLLGWVFGAAYRFDPLILTLLCLGSLCLGLLWILVHYDLARGRAGSITPWIGVAAVVTLGSAWHAGPAALATSMLAPVAIVTALSVSGRRGAVPQTHPAWRGAAPKAHPAPCVVPQQRGPEVDLTVVVPFYNPGDLLRPNLLNLIESLRTAGAVFEVITVEDGCTDGSPATIADLDPAMVRRLALPCNSGKGAALRLGLREGRGRYVGFIDADGDLDPALWQPFLALLRLYEPDVIIGSKRHPLSEIGAGVTWTRRACSRGYQTLVRLLFPRLPVSDTQVGIKVFRRELLAAVLPLTVERRFVFDLELLVVAWRLGFRRIMPAPVTLGRQGPSTVTLRAIWWMFADTLALAWRLHGRVAYGQEGEPAPSSGGRPAAPLPQREGEPV